MKVEARQKIEKQIVRCCIKELLSAGYNISVSDGEDIVLNHSRSLPKIVEAMFSTDMDKVYVSQEGQTILLGWVQFVYGNDGFDVISDYTTNLEDRLVKTNELVEQLGEQYGA